MFDVELMLKNKDEELNLIILELRKSLASLQEKLSKEESEKLVRELVLILEYVLVLELLFLIYLTSSMMFVPS